MNTFIQQGRNKLIKKVSVKTIQKISNKCCSFVLCTLLFFKKSWIINVWCITVPTKILSSITVFNIDNIKCFLSGKSEWFLKYHVALKTRVMMLKIQLCITGKSYVLNYTLYAIYNFRMAVVLHNPLLTLMVDCKWSVMSV